jgi:HAD superfamily hydrolase (TIGR01549 family)
VIGRRLQAVIFDVDGTLVDSVDLHARAWQEALARFGVHVPYGRVRSQIGKGGDQLLPALVPEERLDEIGDALEQFRSTHYKVRYLPNVTAFPGVRRLFERLLADGKRLALASSAKGDELAHYERVANIEGLVGATTSADDADRSKPYPDIFEAALARLGGVPPDRCAVVGDTPWDALAAGRAGLRTVGLLCGGFAPEALVAAGCVALYRDPEDLRLAYERLGDQAFEPARAESELALS